jgi:hypothetical protein
MIPEYKALIPRLSWTALVAVVTCLAFLPVIGVATSSAVPSVVPVLLGPVMSQRETNGVYSAQRDIGFSAPTRSGQSLWIFGDTQPIYGPGRFHRGNPTFVASATAILGPITKLVPPQRDVEVRLGHPPGSNASGLSEFLSQPTDTYLKDGSGRACVKPPAAYPARWVLGEQLIPGSNNVLLAYLDVCVYSGTQFDVEGWGYAVFSLVTFKFTTPPTDIVLPRKSGSAMTATLWESPVFTSPTRLAFFNSVCYHMVNSVCTHSRFETVSVPFTSKGLASLFTTSPTVMTMTDGRPFTTLYSAVTTFQPTPRGPVEYLDVEQLDESGNVAFLVARVPTGPWREVATTHLPGCPLHSGSNVVGYVPPECYSIRAHAEYDAGNQLLVTYYNFAVRWKGRFLGNHLMAVRVTLPSQ